MSESAISSGVSREAYFAAKALLPDGPLSLEILSAELGTSPRTLQRRLSEDGQSFSELIRRVQLEASSRLLEDTSLTIGDISKRVGFSSQTSFSRAFHCWTGLSPRAFRRQHDLARDVIHEPKLP